MVWARGPSGSAVHCDKRAELHRRLIARNGTRGQNPLLVEPTQRARAKRIVSQSVEEEMRKQIEKEEEERSNEKEKEKLLLLIASSCFFMLLVSSPSPSFSLLIPTSRSASRSAQMLCVSYATDPPSKQYQPMMRDDVISHMKGGIRFVCACLTTL